GYMLGVQRSLTRTGRVWWAARGEILNTRLSLLQTSRNQTPFYFHAYTNQGHTQLGQVLGSVGGDGGGAAELAIDRYSPSGRISLMWSRIMRQENRAVTTGVPDAMQADVMHALTLSG